MEYLTENLGNDVRELLLFKLDDTIYAIDSCKISEILRLMKLEIPEKLPENAKGGVRDEVDMATPQLGFPWFKEYISNLRTAERRGFIG